MKHAAVAGLLLLLPGTAVAQSLRLTDTAVLEYRGNNNNGIDTDDDYGVGVNKLYLNGQIESTSLNAQIDTFLFSNFPDVANPTGTNPSLYRREARLERLSLVQPLGEVATVTLGDAHVQIGRGIALSLRKVDELGTDQALRGGLSSYEGDSFSAMAFAGRTNIANLDGVTQRHLEDPEDTLAGASATLHLGRADVSFHGVYLEPKEPTLASHDDDRTMLAGGYVELPAFDWLSLYAEGAVEQYRLAGKDTPGTAAYGSADIDLQVVSLLVEGLFLDEFQVMGSQDSVLERRNIYNQPPTLERIDQEVLDNQNVRGGRAKVSRAFFDGSLVLYTSGMFRQYGPENARYDAIHGYGGFELTYGMGASRWFASGGYRSENEVGQLEAFKTMAHGETDWVQSIGGGLATHVTVNHESRFLRGTGATPDRDYIRGSTFLGLDRGGLGSVMAEIGYDTFNENNQQFFLAGIIAWEYEHWLIMRGVIGSQRGGIKCIGGVCRDFPPFSGARLEATVHYDAM